MYENIAIANINKDVNGIELSFPGGKPDFEVLKSLRESGFRWHNKKQVWYARNTVDHVKAVEGFVDLVKSDRDFGVTPGGTVDIQALRNKRLNIQVLGVRDQGLVRGVDELVNSPTIRNVGQSPINEIAGNGRQGNETIKNEREAGYDLGFGHKGNGIVVWNRLQEEHGDYKRVAHISADRVVTYYDKNVPEGVKQKIRDFAAKADPTISATQDQKVFRTGPFSMENGQGTRDNYGVSELANSETKMKMADARDGANRAGYENNKKDTVLAGGNDSVGLNTRMREWYEKTYSHDNSAVELLWDNNATFQDLFNRLDSFLNIYAMIPRDSVIRERLFSQLADTLGCNYDMIYNQWDNGVPGALTRFVEGKTNENVHSEAVQGLGARDEGLDSGERLVGSSEELAVEELANGRSNSPTVKNSELGPVGEIGVKATGDAKEQGKVSVKKDCLADFYDKVGTGEIYRDSTVEGALWSPAWGKCYYEDLNARICVKVDSAQVIELDNAMKRGKTCKIYSISTSWGKDMRLYLANECGVRSPKDLYDLVRSGRELPDGGRLSVREDKGVEVFSPFVSVKPLKELPEKWNKANLVRAIMSGQVYSAVWKERLTDDYAYDAARGFLQGLKVDLPEQAEDLVEGCRDPYIKTESVDEKGIATVYYSYANETKTFQFDVNCDLAQSMERQREMDRAVQEHNDKIKDSIVKVSEKDIDDGKVYVVDRVVEDDNTGKLGVAPEILQGFVLKDLLDFGGTVGGITGVKEAELIPGRLYEVADFFQRREYAEEDPRIVEMGNWQQLASGKAVRELTQEGVRLKISIGGYERPRSFVQAKRSCLEHIEGKRFWGPGVCDVDYVQSLEKLENEEARIARDRFVRREPDSLEDAIGFAEVKKDLAHGSAGLRLVETGRDSER